MYRCCLKLLIRSLQISSTSISPLYRLWGGESRGMTEWNINIYKEGMFISDSDDCKWHEMERFHGRHFSQLLRLELYYFFKSDRQLNSDSYERMAVFRFWLNQSSGQRGWEMKCAKLTYDIDTITPCVIHIHIPTDNNHAPDRTLWFGFVVWNPECLR